MKKFKDWIFIDEIALQAKIAKRASERLKDTHKPAIAIQIFKQNCISKLYGFYLMARIYIFDIIANSVIFNFMIVKNAVKVDSHTYQLLLLH